MQAYHDITTALKEKHKVPQGQGHGRRVPQHGMQLVGTQTRLAAMQDTTPCTSLTRVSSLTKRVCVCTRCAMPMPQAFCESFDEEVFEKLWHEFVMQQDPSKAPQPLYAAPTAAAPPASSAPGPSTQAAPAPAAGATAAASSFGLPAAVLSARGIGSEADNGGMYDRLLHFLQSRKVCLVTSICMGCLLCMAAAHLGLCM